MERKTETIGKVTLDLSRWPGEDLYSDGRVEDELLSIVRDLPPEKYEEAVRERADWPTLYHLSAVRGNIAGWYPFTGTEKVLEIGAGPGAITQAVVKKAGRVDCVDLSRTRSRINAYRNRDAENLNIYVGNFEDIEPELDDDYDLVLLIGVLEYAGSYLNAGDPYTEELLRIRHHLKKDGRLMLAIENRLGMKYFAGCREDHSARYFDGIENYPGDRPPARTFSLPALKEKLENAGFSEYSVYYPYPDYKLMSCLYSDRRLPSESELTENIRNFDHDRLLLFDEKKAYGGMLRDGLYSLFANSFLILTGPELPVTYVKYSNDRAPEYQIKTWYEEENGVRSVFKGAENEAARPRIEAMPSFCRKLSERYEGSGLSIACCIPERGAVKFPFVPGRPLDLLLDAKLAADDPEGFLELVREYRNRVGFRDSVKTADIDMTFSNILVSGDEWTAIDCEWVADRAIPAEKMVGRAMHCYFLADEKRLEKIQAYFPGDEFWKRLGMTAPEAQEAAAEEKQFQNMITGGRTALGALRAAIGRKVLVPAEIMKEQAGSGSGKKTAEELATVQVYFDTGKGFSEEESYFVDAPYQGEGMIVFHVEAGEEVRFLRVDPALCPCLVYVHGIKINGQDAPAMFRYLKSNGQPGKDGSILFATADPNMVFDLRKVRKKQRLPDGKLSIGFTVQMTGIPGTMAQALLPGRRRGHHGSTQQEYKGTSRKRHSENDQTDSKEVSCVQVHFQV